MRDLARAEMSGEFHSGGSWRPWGLRIAAAGVLVANHARTLLEPSTVRGPALVLDHLFSLGASLALLALCAAVGLATLRRIGVDRDSDIERLAFAVALGAAGVAALLLGVGALVGVGLASIGLSLALAALVARRELAGVARLVRAAWSELGDRGGLATRAVMSVVGVALAILAFCPPSDYDSLMYHVQIPSKFLEQGAIFVPADNLHVAFVGLVHFLYLPLLAIGSPSGCAILNGCFALLLGASLFAFVSRWISNAVGVLSSILLWGSGILILTAATPKVDVTLALFLLLGHVALLRASEDPGTRRSHLVLAGLLIGSAIGVKYLALLYFGPLIAVHLVLRAISRGERGGLATGLVTVGVALAIGALPWLVKNQVLLGAPLYPYFTERLPRPWLAALYEARDVPWKTESSGFSWGGTRLTTSPLRSVREPFDLVSWFVSPERLTPELEGRAYGANLAFVLVPLALWRLRERRVAGLLLPGIGFLLLLLWARDRVNLRYLLPALPILTVAAAIALDGVVTRIGNRRLRLTLLSASLAVSLFPATAAVVRKMHSTRAVAHVLGLASREEFLQTRSNREVAGYSRMVARVNRQLPAGAVLLLLYEGRGYGFRARVLQDNGLSNWPRIAPLVEAPNCLERSGITHVLVGFDTLEYFRKRGLDLKLMRLHRFAEFADRCLELIDSGEGMKLYRVTDGSARIQRRSEGRAVGDRSAGTSGAAAPPSAGDHR